MEIIETNYTMFIPANRANYKIEGGEDKKAEGKHNIVFSEEIGLAIEPPSNGMSLDQLWRIV